MKIQMVNVEINKVQLGTAKAIKEKNGRIKFEKFKPDKLRKNLFELNWASLGPVDAVLNNEKMQFRIYPSGSIKPETMILEVKIRKTNKKTKTEIPYIDLEWQVGGGKRAQSRRSLLFRIPDTPPPYVKGSKPKEITAKTPAKSKKQVKS